ALGSTYVCVQLVADPASYFAGAAVSAEAGGDLCPGLDPRQGPGPGDTVTRTAHVCGTARIYARRRVCRLCQWDARRSSTVSSVVGSGPEAPHRCGAGLAVRSICSVHPGAGAGPEGVPQLRGGFYLLSRKHRHDDPARGDDLHGAGLARPV